MSAQRRERRSLRSQKRLHMLADRFYDETVARKDKQGMARRAGTVEEQHIVAAYVDGSKYHRERIKEFKPQFSVIVPATMPLPEQIHNFS